MVMNEVLRGITFKSAVVYVDDILVYSQTFEQHLDHLQQVFERLRQAGLRIKPSKCKFGAAKVTYLGHDISMQGIEMETINLGKVQRYPRPTNVKTVRGFIGLCNYYRRFVKAFSEIARPLHNLTKQGVAFHWDESCEKAFQHLKKCMTSEPVVLAHPNFDKPFILSTDASDMAIGYVLGQTDDQDREHVISYGGRSLTKDEKKWDTTDKECLAIVEGLRHYEPYVSNQQVTIYTDHWALQWLDQKKQNSKRVSRWAIDIQPFRHKIVYKPGKQNGAADAMSRIPHESSSSSSPIAVDAIDIPGEYRECIIHYATEVHEIFTLESLSSVIASPAYNDQCPIALLQSITTTAPSSMSHLQQADSEFGDII